MFSVRSHLRFWFRTSVCASLEAVSFCRTGVVWHLCQLKRSVCAFVSMIYIYIYSVWNNKGAKLLFCFHLAICTSEFPFPASDPCWLALLLCIFGATYQPPLSLYDGTTKANRILFSFTQIYRTQMTRAHSTTQTIPMTEYRSNMSSRFVDRLTCSRISDHGRSWTHGTGMLTAKQTKYGFDIYIYSRTKRRCPTFSRRAYSSATTTDNTMGSQQTNHYKAHIQDC